MSREIRRRMATRIPARVALLVGIAVAGCGTDGGGGEPVRPAVVVADSPTLDIGVVEGAPEYQFYRIRAIRRRADGALVVAEAAPRIRLYEADGTYVRTIGAEGEGPGEFRRVDHVSLLADDSILVQDLALQRISVFDSAGTFVRSFRPESPSEVPAGSGQGLLDDGSLVIRNYTSYSPGSAESGFRRDSSMVFRIDRTGAVLDTIRRVPAGEIVMDGADERISITVPPFARSTDVEVRGDRIYVGDNAGPDILFLAPGGTVLDTLRTDFGAVPVTSDDVDADMEVRLREASDENDRRRTRERYRSMPHPDTMPYYVGFEVDARGLVWVAEHRIDWRTPSVWRLYSPTGDRVATVELPTGFGIHEIGEDYLLGRWLDPYDVEHVWLLPLERGDYVEPDPGPGP